jgi:pimeloyl-ACP methyl ester carboxylesterase
MGVKEVARTWSSSLWGRRLLMFRQNSRNPRLVLHSNDIRHARHITDKRTESLLPKRQSRAELLANHISNLMDKLAIPVATFYGCGSGGGTVLAVITNHPTRVRSAIVHEVPFGTIPELDALPSLC